MNEKNLTLKDMARGQAAENADLPSFDLSPVKEILEDDLPQVDESQVGRIRLVRALARKFGPNYKAIPKVREALEHYDKEAKIMKIIKRNRRLFHGR